MGLRAKEIVLFGMLGSILLVVQIGLAFLPNIELVSLLIIIYTLRYRTKALYMIYLFALLEGLYYGFGTWWIMYLYVWTVLFCITMIFRKNKHPVVWALVSACFGLGFGTLCSIPYFFIGGMNTAFAYWVSGIPYDIIHCISNFIVALFLFNPITYILNKSDRIINTNE